MKESQVQKIFDRLFEQLEITSIKCQLPGKVHHNDIDELQEKDISRLLSYASILSLSDDNSNISQSYEIITRLLEVSKGKNPYVVSGAEVIFSRIGNFPGRELLKSRRQFPDQTTKVSSVLMLECLAREAENSLCQNQNKVILTDFQFKLFSSLGEEHSLSVSAPTSAGKSFVLNLDLVRKIHERDKQSIVYIVPTRALISEVSQRIRSTLRSEGLSEVIVRTAPFPIAKNDIKKAVVYVLTQERLMNFINSQEGDPFVTSLIVDEAHEIKKGKRGIVLQNAIDLTLAKFCEADVLFASPLIKNPAYFLTLFGRYSSGKYFVETVSPVSQNVILVSEVKGKPTLMDVSFLARDQAISIGHTEINFKLRGSKAKQKANLALSISSSRDDSVIAFSNGPADAEDVAELIAETMTNFEPSEDILTFVDFIQKDIHPEYPLANCLLNGVAFHYGKMPSLVRSGVERLFKNGDIKLICCTSTLLQGVNLPAKHIIIENPRSGDAPMSRSDFLNLAGRAGRLLKEFHGNIWCIRPASWAEECYKGDQLQDISSAISNLMVNGGTIVQDLLNGSITNSKIKDEAEAVFGKLYHDYMVDPDLSAIEIYRNEDNTDILDETIDRLKKVKITLPLKILENHKSLRPDHLESIYKYLCSQLFLDEYIPMSPYVVGAKKRMENIFKIITHHFDWNVSERFMSWISSLAYKWVRGATIGGILAERVNFVRQNDPDQKVSVIIRDCLKVLEDSIRFKLVKYFSAYIDILRFVIEEKNLENMNDKIEPYHIYLEFGSCNRHSLNLMALGLSRFTALRLEGKFDLSEDVEAEEYLKKLHSMNIDGLDMPFLCKQEVKDLIGG